LITTAGTARDEKEAILPTVSTFGRKERGKPRRSTFLCRQTAALEQDCIRPSREEENLTYCFAHSTELPCQGTEHWNIFIVEHHTKIQALATIIDLSAS